MKKISELVLFLFASLFIASCSSVSSGGNEDAKNQKIAEENGFYIVSAQAETVPVASTEDAADDIAIWYNSQKPESSTIIAADKQRGLVVYNLEGEELFSYPVGNINNVDVHSRFGLQGDSVSLVGASNRSENTINLWKVNATDGSLEALELSKPLNPKTKEVYGFTFYKSITAPRPEYENRFYAITVGTDGKLEQWELSDDNGKIKTRLGRVVQFDSQCEGLVADNETGNLFVAEEAVGIWKMPATPAAGDKKELIGDLSKDKLAADIEGLALYQGAGSKGYLIASSQGNNSFAVFTLGSKNKYLGSFMIMAEGNIDGTSETDGIAAMNLGLGSNFPDGVFVAQDGYNYEGENQVNQNFKLVNWKDIAGQFEPWLLIDNSFVAERNR